jgi:hypothetical protein
MQKSTENLKSNRFVIHEIKKNLERLRIKIKWCKQEDKEGLIGER